MEVDNNNQKEGGGGGKKSELFYTVGSPALVEARKVMAAYSFQVISPPTHPRIHPPT